MLVNQIANHHWAPTIHYHGDNAHMHSRPNGNCLIVSSWNAPGLAPCSSILYLSANSWLAKSWKKMEELGAMKQKEASMKELKLHLDGIAFEIFVGHVQTLHSDFIHQYLREERKGLMLSKLRLPVAPSNWLDLCLRNARSNLCLQTRRLDPSFVVSNFRKLEEYFLLSRL